MSENVEELSQKVRAMGITDRQAMGKSLLAGFQGQQLNDFVGAILTDLPKENLKSAVVEAAKQLPEEEKKAALKEIRGLAPPAEKTRDWLWLVVVSAFAFVLVGTFVTIAIGMFKAPAATGALTKPELVLTMFTSVVGFLAGLFVPSPAANKQQ